MARRADPSASGGVEIDLPGGAVVRLPVGAAPELVIAARAPPRGGGRG